MKNIAVVGLQWGDEGKGKIVDYLSAPTCSVVRYCGECAFHCVTAPGMTISLGCIPSGIMREGVLNYVAAGVLLNPADFLEEIICLRKAGVTVTPENLLVSAKAPMLMDWHRVHQKLCQSVNCGCDGPRICEGNRPSGEGVAVGVRRFDRDCGARTFFVEDLLDIERLKSLIQNSVGIWNSCHSKTFGSQAEQLDCDELVNKYVGIAQFLKPFIDTNDARIRDLARSEVHSVIFESAQGTLLDHDNVLQGCLVSNSCVSVSHIPSGSNVPPELVHEVVGVLKPYLTRRGDGHFPTEGAPRFLKTSSKKVRNGWLDLTAIRYTAGLNGCHSLALCHLDDLTGTESFNVCVCYAAKDGSSECTWQFEPRLPGSSVPVYKSFKGWKEDISGLTSFDDLPGGAKDLIRLIEAETHLTVSLIGVGPERAQMIHRAQST